MLSNSYPENLILQNWNSVPIKQPQISILPCTVNHHPIFYLYESDYSEYSHVDGIIQYLSFCGLFCLA